MNMKNLKILFCLFFLLSIGSTNVWGATSYTLTGTTLNKTLTITGTGTMPDYPSKGAPWYNDRADIKTIVINEGVTHIGAYAFQGITYSYLTIPVSVKSFGARAFIDISSGTNREVYYKGTPNDWVDIDFPIASGATYPSSSPFYNNTSTNNHIYFYDQTSTETTIIAFSEGLETIKSNTFYYTGNITDIYIPHSVTEIQSKAFDHCSSLARITILNTTAPTAADDSFQNLPARASLFVPTGANGTSGAGGFKKLPWYDSTGGGKGPYYIGSSDTDKSYTTTGNNFGTGKVYPLSGSGSGFTWALSLDGTLSITGSGTLPTSFTGDSYNSDNILPWARFRRMINKVIVQANGSDISSLGNIIQYCYAIKEIEIQQTTIPTGTYTINDTFRKSTDKVTLLVKANPTYISKAKSTAPWSSNSSRIQLGLNEPAVFDEGENFSALKEAIETYVDITPIDLQLKRSLSNEYYNTFCSPVDMTGAEVTAMFGAETELVEFDGTEIINDTLRLKFNPATSITAGKPYLIWPKSPVSNPTFTDVNPASIATSGSIVSGTHADFHGTLAPVDASDYAEDKNFIFLLADNKLTYATGGTLKGMRAYFLLEEDTPASVMAKRPVLQIGNGENTTTDLGQVPSDKIQCTKVLRDGQIYILRGEKAYNLQGIEIDRPNKL